MEEEEGSDVKNIIFPFRNPLVRSSFGHLPEESQCGDDKNWGKAETGSRE